MHTLTISLALMLPAAASPTLENPCTNGSFETLETGLNRGRLIDQLKGGVDFWYKAISSQSTELNVQVIPMNEESREGTGSPRATFTVPEEHVGDGHWHHAQLKYDFTGNPKARSVHFAARIVGAEGELLLDDVSYVERVGKMLRFGKIVVEEDPAKPGERCTIRVRIENAGDAPVEAVCAEMSVHPPGDHSILTPDPPKALSGERAALEFAIDYIRGSME